MTTVHVNYTVPVVAVVEIDDDLQGNDTVERVVVIDEMIRLDSSHYRGVTADDGVTPVSTELAERAIAIAEGSPTDTEAPEPWPAWEFGF